MQNRKKSCKNLYTSVFYSMLLLNKSVQARLDTCDVTLWRVVYLMTVAMETQQCILWIV